MAKLTRREPHRRFPIVLTVLAQSAVDVLDEVVQLFDQAVSSRESRAKHKLADQLAERANRSEDKLAIAELVLPVLADPATDTHGASLLNFSLFDLCGLQRSPRLRDLGKITSTGQVAAPRSAHASPRRGPCLPAASTCS